MTECPPDKERLRQLLVATKSLQGAIRDVQSSVSGHAIDNWVGYKQFAIKYTQLAKLVNEEIELPSFIEVFDVDRMPGSDHLLPNNQKEIFEAVIIQLSLLIGTLETHIGVVDDEIFALRDFLQSRLRSAIFTVPEQEKDVQNTIEQLLIGRGMQKGMDYDRETGRVKFSSKEAVPDFIVNKLSLAIEVKLVKNANRVKDVVDEISSDIASYSKGYRQLLFWSTILE